MRISEGSKEVDNEQEAHLVTVPCGKSIFALIVLKKRFYMETDSPNRHQLINQNQINE